MAEEDDIQMLLALHPERLKKSLGLQPPPWPHENAMVVNVPLIGRFHFVRDRHGVMCMSGIVAYWVYGSWASYYAVIAPHHLDGHISMWFIYYYYCVAAMCLISLFCAATMNPGRVPAIDDATADLKEWVTCGTCGKRRPPRAHHCRRCQQCVVRMDHHCPWINNCVGEGNHHMFLLLLFYSFWLSANSAAVLLLHFWYWPKCQLCDHESIIIQHGIWFQYLLSVMAGCMAVFMFSNLMTQHFQIMLNRTTIEQLKAGSSIDNIQLRTAYNGYTNMFGTRWVFLWFLPWRRRRSTVLADVIHA